VTPCGQSAHVRVVRAGAGGDTRAKALNLARGLHNPSASRGSVRLVHGCGRCGPGGRGVCCHGVVTGEIFAVVPRAARPRVSSVRDKRRAGGVASATRGAARPPNSHAGNGDSDRRRRSDRARRRHPPGTPGTRSASLRAFDPRRQGTGRRWKRGDGYRSWNRPPVVIRLSGRDRRDDASAAGIAVS
jgi:hypothetical protein